MNRIFTLLICVLNFNCISYAQVLTGQCESNPCNARILCSSNLVVQQSYASTGNPGGLTNCANCTGSNVAFAGNWVYFQFKCHSAGTFQFTLTPTDSNSNLDWAIWNTTLAGCDGINATNLVQCNTLTTSGATGIGVTCSGNFGPSLNLVAGNTYILGVSRASGGASITGFTLNTTGGTAEIIDPNPTIIESVLPFNINNPVDTIQIKLSKHVRCIQVASGDIIVQSGTNTIPTSATFGSNCSASCTNPINTGLNYGSLTDTLVITFPTALPQGIYSLSINTNAFIDGCAQIPNTTATISFTVPSIVLNTFEIEKNIRTWNLFPNPSSGMFHLQNLQQLASLKELYNAIGQKILTTNNLEIDASHLPKGLYFLKCEGQVRKWFWSKMSESRILKMTRMNTGFFICLYLIHGTKV